MAQEYWMKHTADSEAYGPYSGSELKQYAAEGRLMPTSLVSVDQAKWHEAARIKGLFASAPATARIPIPVPAAPPAAQSYDPEPEAQEYASETEYDVAPPQAPARAPSLAYHTPAVGGDFKPIKRRSIVPFLIVASLMSLCGLTVAYMAFSGSMVPTRGSGIGNLYITLGAMVGYLIIAIPTLILWLVWVAGTHQDLRQMSEGTYDISPGKAVGFSFIPFFDAYWIVYMPWRLSAEVNRHLAARGLPPVSSGTVMGCQITSIVGAVFLPAITPIMYAISMWQVQGGLNRLMAAR